MTGSLNIMVDNVLRRGSYSPNMQVTAPGMQTLIRYISICRLLLETMHCIGLIKFKICWLQRGDVRGASSDI